MANYEPVSANELYDVHSLAPIKRKPVSAAYQPANAIRDDVKDRQVLITTLTTDVKSKDSELTFSAERVLGDNKLNIEYKFMVNGDALKGKGTLDVGGEKRDFDIEGKREK